MTTKTQKVKSATYRADTESLDASYQRWVNRQMEKRALEFSDICNIIICCASWNVNSKPLPNEYDLTKWLLRTNGPPADIYAISLQEIVDLNVMNVVLNNAASDETSASWAQRLLNVLNSTGIEFKLVIEKHLIGLQSCIFSRTSLLSNVSDVRWTIVYTGSYGVTGNKGGIAVRFDILDSPLCFVCAHFHANRDNVDTRNADFQTIIETAVFTPNPAYASGKRGSVGSKDKDEPVRPYSISSKDRNKNLSLNILNHEHIFWYGDLNYRIASELEDIEVFEIVQTGNWMSLRAKDQLNIERDKGNVFQNFEEGSLKFPPTYKYQPGTDLYEQRPDKKLRAPAWCDRILWRTTNKDAVRLLQYQVAPLNLSDHKPVFAWFDCGVRKVVPEKAREVYQDLLFAVDKWINASTPKLNVENRLIDFGKVVLNERYSSTISITNTGTVMAEWLFIPKNNELLVCKHWLKLVPEDGILAPGETSVIKVYLYFSSEIFISECKSDTTKITLEDIVVLRIVNGSDLFCIFNAVVDEAEITNALAGLQKTRKFENPILITSGKATSRTPPPPPPHPSTVASEEPQFKEAIVDRDSDDDENDQQQLQIEEIYHPKIYP